MNETAKNSGIRPRTFQGWIYKGLLPSVFDAYPLAKTLGVSMEYLMTGKDEHEHKDENEKPIEPEVKSVPSLWIRFRRRLYG